jgi:hypothetical protein
LPGWWRCWPLPAAELFIETTLDEALPSAVPAGTDQAGFGSAVIWCKRFAVGFAVAPLAPA